MTRKRPDHGTPLGAEQAKLLHEEITREVIGAFYTVYNVLGYGFLESVYSRALYIELRRRGLRVRKEVTVTAFYEQYPVGHFRVDHLVEECVAVEIKASRSLVAEDRRQLTNWLKASRLEVGLLLHFGPRPEFHRVVSQRPPQFDPAVSAESASSQFPERLGRGDDASEPG